ncbi:MAG: hypothetical protein LBG99_03920 [Propionibacteriaceae bacterium]|jgi:hypothetical protein|nr:hypothetical protein [Propionibacteriaceae bacterium]
MLRTSTYRDNFIIFPFVLNDLRDEADQSATAEVTVKVAPSPTVPSGGQTKNSSIALGVLLLGIAVLVHLPARVRKTS